VGLLEGPRFMVYRAQYFVMPLLCLGRIWRLLGSDENVFGQHYVNTYIAIHSSVTATSPATLVLGVNRGNVALHAIDQFLIGWSLKHPVRNGSPPTVP
jgi:hypothetical protein